MSWFDRFRKSGQPDGAKGLDIRWTGSIADVLAGYPLGVPFSTYGNIYKKQPAVRTVVDWFADQIGQLNAKVYQRAADNDRIEDNTHPVARLLRNPNPVTTGHQLRRALVADLCIYDRAYWRKETQRGLVVGLVRIPPSRLEVEFDSDSLKTTYRFEGKVMSREQMVVFPGYHPDGAETGVSPLETLRQVLAEDWAAGLYREYSWRNGSRQPVFVERGVDAPEWSPEARDRFLKEFGESLRSGQGPPPMLEDGMKAVKAAFSAAESQYIESRQLTQVEVARVYSPALARLLDPTSGGAEEFHRQLYQDALAPLCDSIQDEIDLQLLQLPEFDQGDTYCEFNLAEKLKGSFEQMADTLVRSVGVPYMSINEGRARLNLGRLEGEEYDEPIQPLNVLYGGQPSVVNPTADPGNPEPLDAGGGAMVAGQASSTDQSRQLAEIVQKVYLGVVNGVVTVDEARQLLVDAGWFDLAAPIAAVPQAASRNGFALLEFLDRQEQVVKSRAGAGVDPVWQVDRWNRELGELVGGETAARMNNAIMEELSKGVSTLDDISAVFREAKMEATKIEVTL